MEIDNVIFQDLESFGKERFFKMAMEVLDFFGEILKYPRIDRTLCCIKHHTCYFFSFCNL